MGIITFLASSNYVIVNKELMKILGINESILIGELASEYEYWKNQELIDEQGYFYSTIENVEKNTTLTAHKQRNALNKLKELKIVDVVIRGIPGKRYIKINEQQLLKLLNPQLLKNLTTGSEKISQVDDKNFNTNNNKEKIIKNNNKKNNKNHIDFFGDYQNVFFTKEQFEKLKQTFPKDYNERIQTLDDYIQSSGKKYKDCLATIKNWARKDGYKFSETKTSENDDVTYDIHKLTQEEYGQFMNGNLTKEDIKKLIKERNGCYMMN